MNGDLERRYRRLLRLLPKQYRIERGEEMTGAFLDTAEAEGGGRRWPDPREVVSLLALAVRVRAGAAVAEPGTAKAEFSRLLAVCGAFYLGAMGIAWSTGAYLVSGGLFRPIEVPSALGLREHSVLQAVHEEAQILWVVVFLAFATGMWRTGRVLAVALAGFSLLTLTGTFVAADWPLMAVVAVASCISPPRRPTAAQRGVWSAAALPMLVAGVYAVPHWMPPLVRVPNSWLMNLPGEPRWLDSAVLTAVAAAVCLWNRASVAWLLAVAAVGMQPLLVQTDRMIEWGYVFRDRGLDMVWLFEICLLAAVAVRLLANRRRARNEGTPVLT